MTWREHILSIIIPILFWILLVWICTTIWSYIRDAKKWRHHEWWENHIWKTKWELYDEMEELKKKIEKLEKEKKKGWKIASDMNDLIDWMNCTIKSFEEYTWISQIEIWEKLKEKRTKWNDNKWKKKK